MTKQLKQRGIIVWVAMLALIMVAGINVIQVQAKAKSQQDYQFNVTTDRTEGVCNYKLSGISLGDIDTVEVKAYYQSNGKTVVGYDENIVLSNQNVSNNVLSGSFSMDDFSTFAYEKYTVSCTIGDVTVVADSNCDFSVHSDKYKLTMDTKKAATTRKATLTITDSDQNVVIPGKNNKVALYVWEKGSKESKAVQVGEAKATTTGTMSWNVDVASICKNSGTFYAKAVLTSGNKTKKLTTVIFSVNPTVTSFTTAKTAALDKKASFSTTLKGLSNPTGVKKVTFYVYNNSGKFIYKKDAVNKGNKTYYGEISLKALSYNLGKYTIKAQITDDNGKTFFLEKTTSVDESATAKKMVIQKNKKSCSSTFKLKGAYIPGSVKKVKFYVYYKKNGKFRLLDKVDATYIAKSDVYKATNPNKYAGSYKICAYGTAKWGSEVLLKTQTVKVAKSEAAKNGWYYEKYNGKTYKFYYINGVKQKDLTKILGLKYSSSSNVNKFYIELNRAACCVTVYAYDSVKKKYIIPVKTFTVSVGRDTVTTAGAGGLHTNSSYTPLGTYSICSNGTSVKYTLKPMYEPDGSTCYARWTSHVVGNVYFHAIAVGSQSHYALNPNNYNRLGSAASAGCIRMTVADAKWIYDYASTGSIVKIVKGDSSHPGPLGKNKTIKIASSIHYDPTDPEVPDSRKKKDYKAGLISGYMTKSGKKVGY